MTFLDGELVLSSVPVLVYPDEEYVTVYHPNTGVEDKPFRQVEAERVLGLAATKDKYGRRYIALGTGMKSLSKPWRFEFYLYGTKSDDTYIVSKVDAGSLSVMHSVDGHLLIADGMLNAIQKVHVPSLPQHDTGLKISLSKPAYRIDDMCVINQDGERRLVTTQILRDAANRQFHVVRCINFKGVEMWRFDQQKLDGVLFRPWRVCTNNQGQIYLSALEDGRVVVVTDNHKMEVLLEVPGDIGCIGWCNVTDRLYVVYRHREFEVDMICRFNVRRNKF